MSYKERDQRSMDSMTHQHHASTAVGDGAKTEFALPVTVLRADDLRVWVGGLLKTIASRGSANDYAIRGITPGYPGDTNRVKFTAAVGAGVVINFDAAGG